MVGYVSQVVAYAFTRIMNLIWHPNESGWTNVLGKDEKLQFSPPAAFACSPFLVAFV